MSACLASGETLNSLSSSCKISSSRSRFSCSSAFCSCLTNLNSYRPFAPLEHEGAYFLQVSTTLPCTSRVSAELFPFEPARSQLRCLLASFRQMSAVRLKVGCFVRHRAASRAHRNGAQGNRAMHSRLVGSDGLSLSVDMWGRARTAQAGSMRALRLRRGRRAARRGASGEACTARLTISIASASRAPECADAPIKAARL